MNPGVVLWALGAYCIGAAIAGPIIGKILKHNNHHNQQEK